MNASEMTASELRKHATSLGIKNVAKFKKEFLLVQVDAVERENAAQAAAKAKAEEAAKAKPAKKSNRCTICNLRPINRAAMRENGTPDFDCCEPCLTEANWENTHSDNGHDIDGPESDDAMAPNVRVNGCWVCYPELNRASASYVMTKGSSREGMKINVTLRADGAQKAAETGTLFVALGWKGEAIVEQTVKLTVIRRDSVIELHWDSKGRFLFGTITAAGKTRKVRNVAEALRLAASGRSEKGTK